VDDDVRSLILSRTDSTTIRNLVLKKGFETLRMDGGYKVLDGVTSVEEVLLVTHEDSLLSEPPTSVERS
jgi:type II secretory ATPase GspE/PulE/Tfp pilus assembly ATPase PilB-like protein